MSARPAPLTVPEEAPAPPRSGAPRSGGPRRSQGPGEPAGRTARPQGEFAPPKTITPALPAVESFADLDMPARLLATLGAEGVTVPFPIQAATLPNSLAGRDVLGRGRTGSGKTLAFGLAVLARTAGRRAEPRRPLALVLVPTRELAQQVTDALTPYARSVGLRPVTVVGGMSIGRQAGALRAGAELVVATPGRLKDLIERGDCVLDDVGITVLDEADQMADMGFMPRSPPCSTRCAPTGSGCSSRPPWTATSTGWCGTTCTTPSSTRSTPPPAPSPPWSTTYSTSTTPTSTGRPPRSPRGTGG
ncbi:hypothetical protein GCM10023238_36070 [Streptomyces heliomycini]